MFSYLTYPYNIKERTQVRFVELLSVEFEESCLPVCPFFLGQLGGHCHLHEGFMLIHARRVYCALVEDIGFGDYLSRGDSNSRYICVIIFS